MKYFLLFVVLFSLFNGRNFAQENSNSDSTGIIGINSPFSYKMIEPNQNLRKLEILLEARQNNEIKSGSLTIGSSLIAIADYQKSNTDSKFAYLMRIPTSANQIGKEVSEAVIHSFDLMLAGTLNDWLAIYADILYDPEQSYAPGTITALARNQLQLRTGFIAVGDLRKFPLYGSIGKMNAPFGQTGSVNPFTNSTMWHAFGGLGYGAQIGFKKWDLNASIMFVQGGAQFRAMNTPVGDSTNVPSKLNNFTADLNYNIIFKKGVEFLLGGSYLHGSAYNQDYPITHFTAATSVNPAYTFYGKFSYLNKLVVEGSYAITSKVWPGTHNPNPPLDIYEASKVSSLDAGIKYVFNDKGKIPIAVSGEFSNFIAGPDGAPWERQNQLVFGVSGLLRKSSRLFLEFIMTEGYVPLNFISGGNLAPGETHSVRDANSYVILIGGMITL